MKQWTPQAESYDFGRPFPAEKIVALFSSIAKESDSHVMKVFEPGCGTGRVLLPLAQFFPNWTFVGMDSSASCLDVINKKVSTTGLIDNWT